MSIRGPQALASLDEAMRDIRREEDEISKRLARSAERISKMRGTEADLFRQLAQLRLDPAVQAELDGRISQAEAKARAMMKAHAANLSQSEKDLAAIDASLAQFTADRAAALKTLDARQADFKALASKIGASLAKDPAFAAKRKQATDLAAIAAQSMRKTEQAEADREQKGKPYRDDGLFMYLWACGYGTSSYHANNLIRYLDGLVAGLVKFNKARPNFAMLNEIPLRLREHAEQQIAKAKAAEAEADALENQAIDAAGGKPIRDELNTIQAKITKIDADMVAAEDKRDATAKALADLSQGSDPAFADALAALAAGLGREDIQSLLAEARQTRTGQDDTIIAQIDDNRARIKSEDAGTQEQQDRLETLATRRRELEDIQWEFKKQRFDDPRSSFGEEKLVGDLLNDFLRGGISAATYWDQWRHSQNWQAGTSDWGGGTGSNNGRRGSSPWAGTSEGFSWPNSGFGGNSGGGGLSWPSGGSSGSRSGGSFSRPRTGSRGNRKSGGFKTGGGF